jgi:hypothetical protein
MLLTAILSTKLAAVITSAVVAAGSLTGIGYAANNASPGDVLYGLDCAMESVGLGDGGVHERIREATKMVERGDVEQGLNHAARAIHSQAGLDGNGEANSALIAASNAVQKANQTANWGEAGQIKARVAEMLQWMSTAMVQGVAQGDEFGQGVAERARESAGEADQLRTQTRNQTQTQTLSQDDSQEQSGATYQNQNGEVDHSPSGQGSKGGK